MNPNIENALQHGISFENYRNLFEQLVSEGKTTGENQSEGYVSFTKLNLSRYHRALKFVEISDKIRTDLQELQEPLTAILITEAWCGDASQILPVIEKLEELAPNFTVKIVLRDENDELMNQFLTNGSKSIPKLIVLNNNEEVLASWGPRPSAVQQKVISFKQENPNATSMDVSNFVQKIYNEDKGILIQTEISQLLVSVCCTKA